GPEHARADPFVLVVHEHGGVAIEADVAAVAAALLLAGTHDDGLHDLALLHRAIGRGFLHGGRHDVAEPRVAAGRPADRVGDGDIPRAGVVGNVEDRTHLDHGVLLGLDRLAHDAGDDPALAAAQRTALDDGDLCTRLRALLVVGHELRGATLRLAVQLVTDDPLDGDDDG